MTTQFNLVASSWIPVRYADRTTLVSLETLFAEAESIVDLDCVPHERISIMRLLICITQTVFDPPEDSDSWDGYAAGMAEAVPVYLRRGDIFPHFELFGDGPRFLQVPIEEKPEPVSSSKLIPHLAAGDNSTLFDQEGGNSGRLFDPATLAKALLAFQCFYPSYGRGYKGTGPCVDGNMLHTLLLGESLSQTIVMNCVDGDLIRNKFRANGIGKPIWELSGKDPDFAEQATRTYLGRLAPRHRSVWLLDDGSGFYLKKEGMIYPAFEEAIESTATIVTRENKGSTERCLLAARLDKAAWRDLHAVTVLHGSGEAPMILQSHIDDLSDDEGIPIWIGALVTKKAKFLDTIESRITVPMAMFGEEGRLRYQIGIHHAETQERSLWGAVLGYGKKIYGKNPKIKQPKLKASLAKQRYWTELEYQVDQLLAIVKEPNLMKGQSFGEGDDPWSEAVWLAARTAYEHICPRQTPRQLQAFVIGLKSLRPKARAKTIKRKETAKDE